ncbi:MAG: molybdopterin-dependent oxidoreductase, partial [Parvularculaceae bacterium]|nr:molybdopterin-dependent oxidoreductase [Parvularculaceae bacterium]
LGALARSDGEAVLAEAARLGQAVGVVKEGWNGFNVLQVAAARVAGLDMGFLPGPGGRDFRAILAGVKSGDVEVVFNLGADEIDPAALAGAFVVYQGHHGDAGVAAADVVLPGAAYTEQSGVYVNSEGRAQMTRRANFPPGEAREDWAILRALSDHVGKRLPYDDLFALRQAMIAETPALGRIGSHGGAPLDLAKVGKAGPLGSEPFRSFLGDFFMTNAVARASKTMAECSAAMSGAATVAAE